MTAGRRFDRLFRLRTRERQAAAGRLGEVLRSAEIVEERHRSLADAAAAIREAILGQKGGFQDVQSWLTVRAEAAFRMARAEAAKGEVERMRRLEAERRKDLLQARIREEQMRYLMEAAEGEGRRAARREEARFLDEVGQRSRGRNGR